MDLLISGLEKLGISQNLIEKVLPLLNKYISELEEKNQLFDLVGAIEHNDVIIRHILDSLSAWNYIKSQISEKLKSESCISLADIGSGAGLPGIPLSIMINAEFSDRDIKVFLLERMTKRADFLDGCIRLLQLNNVQVICEQLERINQESFDFTVFRAFRPLDKKMTKCLLRVLKHGGIFFAYKAKLEKITEEMEGVKSQIPEYKIEKLIVPYLEENERNLVIVERK